MTPPPLPPRPLAIFLDLDGTLLELRDDPAETRADAALADLLDRLAAAAEGALALVSGRTVASIDRLFSPRRFAAAGQHGAERRDAAGVLHRHGAPDERLAALRRRAEAFMARQPSLLLEDKGASLALHYRRAPYLEPEVRALCDALVEEGGGAFVLQAGKHVCEIKPAGRDKGAAIAEFMAERTFRGRLPLFVGDDLSDEFGFAAVNRLGGIAVKVGAGESIAPWRLPDIQAARCWLAEYAVQPVI
jgi:trehalose 6-phosphate phosphatase